MPVKYDKAQYKAHIAFCLETIVLVAFKDVDSGIRHRSTGYIRTLCESKVLRQGRPKVTSEKLALEYEWPRNENLVSANETLPFFHSVEFVVDGLAAGDGEVLARAIARTGIRKGTKEEVYSGHFRFTSESVTPDDIIVDKKALLAWCVKFLEDCGFKGAALTRFPKCDRLTTNYSTRGDFTDTEIQSGRYYFESDISSLATSYLLKIGQDYLQGKPLPFAESKKSKGVVELTAEATSAAPSRAVTPADVETYVACFLNAVRKFPVVAGLLTAGVDICDPIIQFYLEGEYCFSNWMNEMTSSRHQASWIHVLARAGKKADRKRDTASYPGDDLFHKMEAVVAHTRRALDISKEKGVDIALTKELVAAFHSKLMMEDGQLASELSLIAPIKHVDWRDNVTYTDHPLKELGTRALYMYGHELDEKIRRTLSNRVTKTTETVYE